ncbi:microtubule-associated protein 4 isoform X2 [Denticeps clupeoides]|uniref:microtubule-associated protein 4 isoform X2 n=1 Tax=Denticeps clupeoides TaxID=299321 RepID=UPI0010A40085|nr:microtubule-associated protein 4-like isoform X2 [Denticeps clupeoides]
MDLSLRDALTDGKPPLSSESMLKRDFVASLQAESYDDKVGETVSKSDYRPLLDGKKEGTGSVMDMPDQWGHQQMGSTVKNSADSFMGFSQTGVSMNTGMAPFQSAKPPAMAEPFRTSPLFGFEPPKPAQTSGKPNDSGPLTMKDNAGDNLGRPWTGVDKLGMDTPFSPTITTGTDHHDDQTDNSSEPSSPNRSQGQDPASGEEEKGSEVVNGKQQKRKKKRRNREEVNDLLESLGSPDSEEERGVFSPQGCSSPPSVEEEGWESELWAKGGAGGRIRARRNKSRKKLPEEWGTLGSESGSPVVMDTQLVSSSSGVGLFSTTPVSIVPSDRQQDAVFSLPTGIHAGDTTFKMAGKWDKDHETDALLGSQDKQASPELPPTGLASYHSTKVQPFSADQKSLSPTSHLMFLDSVLQTPPDSSPPSQATPVTSPFSQTTTALSSAPAPKPTTMLSPAPLDTSTLVPTTLGNTASSSLNPRAPPFIPSLIEHQDALLAQLPLLEVKEEKKPEKGDATNLPEKMDKPEKVDKNDHPEKKEDILKKTDNGDKTQKGEKIIKDEEKPNKDNKVEKNEKLEKADKPEKTNKEDKAGKKESEKNDKTAKTDKNEKTGKGAAKSPNANGSKDLTSTDSKAKPTVGSTKPNTTKTRPNSLSTRDTVAPPKRTSPPANATGNKKSPSSKNTTPSGGTMRTTTVAREVKSKTTENGTTQRHPPVPKANGAPSTRTAASKGESPSTAKTEAKPGESKKPGAGKTSTGNSTRPRTTRTPTTAPATPPTTNGAPRPSRITKPPVPKQTPLEKKPPVPCAPRTRPPSAPMPDLKNVRSKIGSTDNMKYQPGGGKVTSDALGKGSHSKETGQGKVQIVHKKLDFSHITSRCGSRDNIKHVPGGGNVQILNKKVDLSKVTSKCGSKDNIKHKPGGGDVKIESHKMNVKAKSKIGSLDKVGEETEGGKTPENVGESPSPPGIPAVAPASGPKENGLKESTHTPNPMPSVGDGLRDPIQD